MVGVALLGLLLAGGTEVPAAAALPARAPSAPARSGAAARPGKRKAARALRARVKRVAVKLRLGMSTVARELRGSRPEIAETPAARVEAERLHRRFAGRTEVLAAQAADPHVAEVTRYSERGGRYLILSDLHWGRGRTRRGWWPGEDFRQDEAFVRFIGNAAADPRPTTLILNGDWLELIRHVDYDSSDAEVRRIVEDIVRGHQREVRALTRAVAHRGLRVLYTRGNHDVPLVDPRVRAILMDEMIRVGRLDAGAADRFRKRVAWSGHAAALGAYAEGLVFHGDLMDPINNWRSPVNPYDGHRQLEANLGWQIVSTLLRPIDLLERAMTEREKIKGVYRYVRRTVNSKSAAGLLLRALIPIPRRDAGERLAAQDDDQVALRAWVERSGVAERAGRALPGETVATAGVSDEDWARGFERVVARSPEPILDRLRSGKWGLNVGRVIFGFLKSMLNGSKRDRQLVDRLGELPRLRFAIWGHTHLEATLTRPHPTRGTMQYVSSGTWTRTDGGWPLDVVVATTDGDGRLALDGLHRTQRSGDLIAIPPKSLRGPLSRWQRVFQKREKNATPMIPPEPAAGAVP
jgi:UDP-2,3-diacylglucosamine pyrophosphatase LpxH